MSNTILNFDQSFLTHLKEETEKILGKQVTIGEAFKSSDSFAYLINSNTDKFVGKIYRFEHWPPKGKLQIVEKLLNDKKIPHEEIIYTSYDHSVFKFGWSLSKYISGGSAKSLRKDGKLSNDEYFTKLGKLLQEVHTVNLNSFGSIQDKENQFNRFQEYVEKEINEQDYENLSKDYPQDQQVLETAKKWVLDNMNNFDWEQAILVHDDANEGNIIWHDNTPILIDWTDSLAAPPIRDFATLTFRQDNPVLDLIESGYGQKINRSELKFHQIMRFIRLGRFYYLEDKDLNELRIMMERLKLLINRNEPFGI